MTGFTPPPRRELPPEVRDRLRRRLWRGLDVPGKARFARARTSLAAAIGVVVIAACTVIFAQTVPATTKATPASTPEPEVGQTAEARPTADTEQAAAELDRCYQAASSMGRSVPERPQWSVSFMAEAAGISVTAARADGKPLFCESTLTSVTVSDPDAQPAYAKGSATGALFATPNGTIAGVVDPAWQRFEVRVTNGSSFAISELEASDGLFVMYTSIPAGPNLKLHAQELPANSSGRPDDNDPQYPIREMTAVAAPLTYTMDRPVVPPPDRSSPRGQALQQCMSRSGSPLPDIDSWQPAASAVINGTELIMATNARGIASCQWRPYKTPDAVPPNDQVFRAYIPIPREPRSFDARQFIVQTDGNVGLLIGGTVRPDATRMTVLLDGKIELDTDVRTGTFLSVVPDSLTDEFGGLAKHQIDEMTAVIYDAKGNTIYSGLFSPR